VPYAAGFSPLWVTAGDLNSDGKLAPRCSGGTWPAMRLFSLSLPLGTNAITAIDSGSSGFAAPIECSVGRVNSATTSVQAETVTGMNGSTVLATTTIVPGRPAAPLTLLTATTYSKGSLRWPGGSTVSLGDDRGYAAAGKGVTPVYGKQKALRGADPAGYNHNLYCPTLTWSRDRSQRLRWARIQMTRLQVSRANPPGSGRLLP
jgi:hypothetical protein